MNWYDYDATLGRFITQDRFTEKYSALSPYQYGANNPACNMDVNGDSIVVLKDKLHLGLLIQNENNKWAYYSFNGVKAYESTNEKFGAPRDNKGEMIWNTPQEFLDSDYNNLNEEGNNGYGYQEGFLIPTNSEQDNIVKETFLQAVGQGYSLINNHCSIAVQKSLKAIGLKTRFKIGYLPFVVSPISTIRINRDPYLPNEAYIVIKMKNRGYVIKRNDNEY